MKGPKLISYYSCKNCDYSDHSKIFICKMLDKNDELSPIIIDNITPNHCTLLKKLIRKEKLIQLNKNETI